MKAAQVLLLDTPKKLVVDERRDDDTTSDNPTNKRQQLDEDISSNAAATGRVIKWSDNSTVVIAILTSCWYYSSSITAISTQLILNKQKQDDGKQEVILAALVLTSLQLLIGSAVGKLTLHFVSYYYDHSTLSPIKGGDHQSQKQYPLGLLHGLGCICTNVGFGFGSASLVQIVKLLEPIETLILCVVIQYMTYSGINSFTDTISQIVPFRKAIATLIIISGTFMLLSQKSLELNTYSLLFALGSGMCMSLRNVIKKKIEKRGDKNHTVVPTIPNGIQDFLSITISATMPTVLITIVMLVYNHQLASSILYKIINNNSGVLMKAVFCHCIYNMASISVLGFTSAPAHSLLNVGKRIINVLAATMFFHIPLSFVGKIGMLVAATGALLYNDIWLLVFTSKIDNNRMQHRRYFTRLLMCIIVVATFSTNNISPFLSTKATSNVQYLRHSKATTEAYWIWGVDADVPPETTLMLKSIISDESVEKLHIYCGTRQCYETIISMEVISQQEDLIQLNFLRVPDISYRTKVLNTYLASQEMLAILRLQLPGLLFEHFIQLGSILAVLEQSIAVSKKGRHIYLDPLMPACAAEEVLSLPSSDGVQIIYSEEDSSASNYMTQLSWVRSIVVDNINTGALTQAVSALERLLYRPRGEELVVGQLSDDWERVICKEDGLSCIPIFRALSRSESCSYSLLSQSLATQLTSHFYLPGYGSHAGCPSQPRQSLRQLYEFAEGDVYQTLAALQFVPRVDNFIDVNVGYPSFDEVMRMPNRKWKKGSHSIVCEHTEKCKRWYGKKVQSESLDGCLINDSFSGWSNKWPDNPGNNGSVYFITAARWFEHFDEGTTHSWPPPDHIKPIFVGHRIEKKPSENMLQWMRKHQEETNTAVGARDTYSQGLLCKSGISAMVKSFYAFSSFHVFVITTNNLLLHDIPSLQVILP